MVRCFQNIWFSKRTHPSEHRNGHQLSTKWALAATNHLSVCCSAVCRKALCI